MNSLAKLVVNHVVSTQQLKKDKQFVVASENIVLSLWLTPSAGARVDMILSIHKEQTLALKAPLRIAHHSCTIAVRTKTKLGILMDNALIFLIAQLPVTEEQEPARLLLVYAHVMIQSTLMLFVTKIVATMPMK